MIGLILLAALGSGFLGALVGYLVRKSMAQKRAQSAELIIQKAKKKANKIVSKSQEKKKNYHQQLLKKENRLEERGASLQKKQQKLKNQTKTVKDLRTKAQKTIQEQKQKLQKLASLTQEEARQQIIQKTKEEHNQEIKHLVKKLETQGKKKLERRSKDILATALERFAPSQAADLTTSTVSLPDEDLKGRIIGKQGRNIHHLEKLTGCEIIVDDTPEAVTISGFNPIRRQIAKISLQKLIKDGRIQPARIERKVKEAKKEIKEKTKEAGESAVYECDVLGLDDKLIEVLGRLCFRSSYGQNALLHSIEVSLLASAMAEEIDGNIEIAKKAGLLHDIGKSIDREIEGTHVEIGRRILKKFNIDKRVIKAMQAHHEDYKAETLEAILVKTADILSGARPGARKNTLENYLKRIKNLEKIAQNFEPVNQAYAIEAGREIRVFVRPEDVNDLEIRQLAGDIAQNIETELQYPGEIKINVIRETRVVEYAR